MSGRGPSAAGVPITQICDRHGRHLRIEAPDQIGGSRATAATSDHNAARLAFQGASDPIADSARLLLAFSS
jgi:hypothetical protein